MGNTLDAPIRDKTTSCGAAKGFKWGVSSMQGWRISMEDAHIACTIPPIQDDVDGEPIVLENHFFFAVMDGHGGTMAAEFSKKHLLPCLCRHPNFIAYAKSKRKSQERKKTAKKFALIRRAASKKSLVEEQRMINLLQTALEDSFVEVDRLFLRKLLDDGLYRLKTEIKKNATGDDTQANASSKAENGASSWGFGLDSSAGEGLSVNSNSLSDYWMKSQLSGTTVSAVFLTPDYCICANLGDSRTVLDSIPLSNDHKPNLPEESKRILEAGGTVSFGRVRGELAVSRALGDFEFKNYNPTVFDLQDEALRQFTKSLEVSPFPEVKVHLRTPNDQILVIACDGVWDVMQNADCCNFIQTLVEGEGETNVGLVTEEVLDQCLTRGSRDNMTIIVVQFAAQPVGSGGGVLRRRLRRPKS